MPWFCFMNHFARCERIHPCGSKWERHFNQHVMLKLFNQVLLKLVRSGDDLAELLVLDYCVKCLSPVMQENTDFFYFKKENLWSTWLADVCWMKAVIDDFWDSRYELCCVSATLCFSHMPPVLFWSKQVDYRSVFHFITVTSGQESYCSTGSYLCELMYHSYFRELISSHLDATKITTHLHSVELSYCWASLSGLWVMSSSNERLC